MVLYRGTINSRATSINLLSLQALTRQEKPKTGKEKLTLLSQLQPIAHTYSTAPRDRNLLQSTLKFIDNATKRKKREGKKRKEINTQTCVHAIVSPMQWSGSRDMPDRVPSWEIYSRSRYRQRNKKWIREMGKIKTDERGGTMKKNRKRAAQYFVVTILWMVAFFVYFIGFIVLSIRVSCIPKLLYY